MRAYNYPELPEPEPDYPMPKSFTFSACGGKHVAERRHYCTGRFTTRKGDTIYCNCECHQPDERD